MNACCRAAVVCEQLCKQVSYMLQAGCDDHLGNLERLPCLQGDSRQNIRQSYAVPMDGNYLRVLLSPEDTIDVQVAHAHTGVQKRLPVPCYAGPERAGSASKVHSPHQTQCPCHHTSHVSGLISDDHIKMNRHYHLSA